MYLFGGVVRTFTDRDNPAFRNNDTITAKKSRILVAFQASVTIWGKWVLRRQYGNFSSLIFL